MQTVNVIKLNWITDRRVIVVGFWIAVVIEMAVLGTLFLNTKNLTESKDEVTHTYIVLGRLDAVISSLSAAGANQRGYLATGDKNYLDGLNGMTQSIGQQISQLHQLTGDN